MLGRYEEWPALRERAFVRDAARPWLNIADNLGSEVPAAHLLGADVVEIFVRQRASRPAARGMSPARRRRVSGRWKWRREYICASRQRRRVPVLLER